MLISRIKKKDADKFSLSFSSSFCPKQIENKAPLPMHKPNIIEVKKVIKVKDEPTEASAFLPNTCPTIKVSAML